MNWLYMFGTWGLGEGGIGTWERVLDGFCSAAAVDGGSEEDSSSRMDVGASGVDVRAPLTLVRPRGENWKRRFLELAQEPTLLLEQLAQSHGRGSDVRRIGALGASAALRDALSSVGGPWELVAAWAACESVFLGSRGLLRVRLAHVWACVAEDAGISSVEVERLRRKMVRTGGAVFGGVSGSGVWDLARRLCCSGRVEEAAGLLESFGGAEGEAGAGVGALASSVARVLRSHPILEVGDLVRVGAEWSVGAERRALEAVKERLGKWGEWREEVERVGELDWGEGEEEVGFRRMLVLGEGTVGAWLWFGAEMPSGRDVGRLKEVEGVDEVLGACVDGRTADVVEMLLGWWVGALAVNVLWHGGAVSDGYVRPRWGRPLRDSVMLDAAVETAKLGLWRFGAQLALVTDGPTGRETAGVILQRLAPQRTDAQTERVVAFAKAVGDATTAKSVALVRSTLWKQRKQYGHALRWAILAHDLPAATACLDAILTLLTRAAGHLERPADILALSTSAKDLAALPNRLWDSAPDIAAALVFPRKLASAILALCDAALHSHTAPDAALYAHEALQHPHCDPNATLTIAVLALRAGLLRTPKPLLAATAAKTAIDRVARAMQQPTALPTPQVHAVTHALLQAAAAADVNSASK